MLDMRASELQQKRSDGRNPLHRTLERRPHRFRAALQTPRRADAALRAHEQPQVRGRRLYRYALPHIVVTVHVRSPQAA